MSDEERLLKMQQLVAMTKLLQSFFTAYVPANYFLDPTLLQFSSPYDPHYQRLLKEFRETYEEVWP